MTQDKIIDHILAAANAPNPLDILVDRLSPSDLQSLLEVYRLRAARLTPGSLLRHYEHKRFVKPATVDPRQLREWNRARG